MSSEANYDCTLQSEKYFFSKVCKNVIANLVLDITAKIYVQHTHLMFLIVIFCIFSSFLLQKMFKKFKVCDCFLAIACYCLHTNADFTQFWKECVKLKKWNDMFTIKDTVWNSTSLSPVTCIVCCKKICWFSDLFAGQNRIVLIKNNSLQM